MVYSDFSTKSRALLCLSLTTRQSASKKQNFHSQANLLSGSLHSQHHMMKRHNYVDTSSIIGGTLIENSSDQGARAKTSEVD